MSKNSKTFKVQTIEQYKILQHINANFHEGALELELIDRSTIKATDRDNASILFIYENEEVTTREL